MSALFSGPPDIPTPPPAVAPPSPKQDDSTGENAANAERLRRLRALGKQKSVYAGELGMGSASSLGV